MTADDARARLEEERARLLGLRDQAELRGNEEASESDSLSDLSSVDQHPADQGTETLERSEALSVVEQIDAQLADVARALELLEAGDYGTCEVCGRPIESERLQARPAARRCLEHQEQLERDARPPSSSPTGGATG